MNKKLLIIVFLGQLSMNVFAVGDAAGHGGEALPRILTFARSEIIKTFPLLVPQAVDLGSTELNRWYAKNHEKMAGELQSLRLTISLTPITDSFFGYESWIRVSRSGDFVVEYNPNPENYRRLVGIINTEHRHSGKVGNTPSVSDVAEYLLHEIGHRYGLGEQDAWSFAQGLVPKFKFNQPLKTRVCDLVRMGDPSTAGIILVFPSEVPRKISLGNFTVYSRLDPQTFSFILVVVDTKENKRVFDLRVSADSEISTATNVEGGWGLTCDKDPI